MAFTIRNISPIPITVMGIDVSASSNLDLQLYFSNSDIISSLQYGELYKQLFGRMIAMINPTDFYNIGATDDQINMYKYAGFMQGCFGDADLHYPFLFDGYGNLLTTVNGLTVDASGLEVAIRGDEPIPADRDSILAMGTEDGSTAGTVHVIKVESDGTVNVVDELGDGYLDIIQKGFAQEDAPHVSGEYGSKTLRRRVDIPASSANASGNWATANQDADGFDYVRDKAYDPATNANRQLPVWSIIDKRTPGDVPIALITTAKAFSLSWADLGPEISVEGTTRVSLWVKTSINGAKDLQFRALAKHTYGGSDEYSLPIYKPNTGSTPYNITTEAEYIELNVDGYLSSVFTWDISNTIPIIQFQIKEGSLPDPNHATCDSAYVTFAWGS